MCIRDRVSTQSTGKRTKDAMASSSLPSSPREVSDRSQEKCSHCRNTEDLARVSLLEKNHELEALRQENIQLKLKLKKSEEELRKTKVPAIKGATPTHTRTPSSGSAKSSHKNIVLTNSESWSVMSEEGNQEDVWSDTWSSVQGSPHATPVHADGGAPDPSVIGAPECG
eukprot:TRINITY_DN317_c0_g1_i5.p1 TRINITY_DN317_c0_g1~~TRINITY_DN317_c0_g1_i5.p1  ORF type:complete len:169 (+),score=42.90 TRINITY_DN317_c0_g1_i5:94-600(+)